MTPETRDSARLALNPRGSWEVRWQEAGRSRRVSLRTADHAEALRLFADWREGWGRRQPSHNPRVGDLLDQYEDEVVRPTFVDQARMVSVLRWLRAGFATLTVRDVNARVVLDYAEARRGGRIGRSPAADGTIRRELGALGAAFRHAVRQRRLAQADCPHIDRPDAPAPRDEWLTEEQVRVLLDFFAKEDEGGRMSRPHRFVVLGLATAARASAIESLTWAQVERHTGLIRYDQQQRRRTAKRRVAAPIADWLMPYLDRMMDERISDWVLDHDGETRTALTWAMKRVARATGDDTYLRVTRHVLRHTAATLMLRAGATLWQVAGVLGDSPETVARTYGHHAQDHLRRAVNAMPTPTLSNG